MTITQNPFQVLIDIIDTILTKNETAKSVVPIYVQDISSLPQNGSSVLRLSSVLQKLHDSGAINWTSRLGTFEIAPLTEENEQKLFDERRRLEDKWYGHENTEKPRIGLANQTIAFNDDETNLEIGKQKCALPPFKNEHYFCRAMFQYKPQESVDWSQVYKAMAGGEEIIGDKSNMRTVQDTMYALNTRIKKVINTNDNLFTWENRSIKRNF